MLVVCLCLHFSQSLLRSCEVVEVCVRHVCKIEAASSALRAALVGLCLFQPFLYSSAYIMRSAGGAGRSVVLQSMLRANRTELLNATLAAGNGSKTLALGVALESEDFAFEAAGGAGAKPAPLVLKRARHAALRLELYEVDLLFFAMPLAVMLCWSSLLWVNLGAVGMLHEGLEWSGEMPDQVFLYEGVYYVEVLALHLACIGTVSHGRSAIEVFYAVLALTFFTTHCMSVAVHALDEKVVSYALLLYSLVLYMLLRNLWLDMVQDACWGVTLVAFLHTVVCFVLCWVHVTAMGQREAGTIIFVRVVASLAVSLALLVLYVRGWEGAC